MKKSIRLYTSLAVIFGSFCVGLCISIQGPTLMDLIDILHVNQDMMSYSLAYAGLAYSFGGFLSGFIFNYLNRQLLIAIYFMIFGIANLITPWIPSYLIFSVITFSKMMAAGGTDCGANVWILEMWPGQDAWLQALHFSFALGTALGPVVAEPFLSPELPDQHELERLHGTNYSQLENFTMPEPGESRIYVPYSVCGFSSIVASIALFSLYFYEPYVPPLSRTNNNSVEVAKQQKAKQDLQQHHQLRSIDYKLTKEEQPLQMQQQLQPLNTVHNHQSHHCDQQPPAPSQGDEMNEITLAIQISEPAPPPGVGSYIVAPTANSNNCISTTTTTESNNKQSPLLANTVIQAATVDPFKVKVTSKAPESDGPPPFYVIAAIFMAACCLLFYCGIEITSMNYLATFAVNTDLQLSKSTAAYLSSALTSSFAVGRGFGIWIAISVKPHILFYGCVAGVAIGNVAMLFFANTNELLLWISVCFFGIGCGPMFPAIVSFYDEKISKVTNTVSGIFILASMFQVALSSLIVGHHIIDNALILIELNLISSVLLLVLFGSLHLLTKVKKNQRVRKLKARLELQATLTPTITVQQHK